MPNDTLAVNGLTVQYRVEGSGPDVVFVHGWASSSRMWSFFIGPLSSRFRCWSLDLPGCGDSDKPGCNWYSIPNFTESLAEFVRLKGLGPARLVGHSMGGTIVLNAAARHPDLVARLVAINPVVTGRSSLKPLSRPEQSRRLIGWALRLSPVVVQPLLAAGGGSAYLHNMRRRSEEFVKGTPDSLLSSGRAAVDYDVSPLLPAISAPALLILGKKDANVPCSEGKLAAERIPGARLAMMNAGHMTTDDKPAEVLQQLQRFLS